jgi:hypothetical protein
MPADLLQPTPYPAINALVHELLSRVQTIVGPHVIGMYLDGSVTSDAFDQASDIDFVVVTDQEIAGRLFSELQAMHEQIAALDSPWATELEGSYISQRALRRYDPSQATHPNIERGAGERLKMAYHHADWIVHRYILRERGITLVGPPPQTLIDPISPTDLRQAMISMLPAWAAPLLQNAATIQARGYQSFFVLSLCRVLYTLHTGTVVSKRAAARWAQEALGERWVSLIERAWAGRLSPEGDASAEYIQETLEFIRYTVACSQQWEQRMGDASSAAST